MTTAFAILSGLVVILGLAALRAELRIDAVVKRVQELETPRPKPSPHIADPGDFGRRRDERYVWPEEKGQDDDR